MGEDNLKHIKKNPLLVEESNFKEQEILSKFNGFEKYLKGEASLDVIMYGDKPTNTVGLCYDYKAITVDLKYVIDNGLKISTSKDSFRIQVIERKAQLLANYLIELKEARPAAYELFKITYWFINKFLDYAHECNRFHEMNITLP